MSKVFDTCHNDSKKLNSTITHIKNFEDYESLKSENLEF